MRSLRTVAPDAVRTRRTVHRIRRRRRGHGIRATGHEIRSILVSRSKDDVSSFLLLPVCDRGDDVGTTVRETQRIDPFEWRIALLQHPRIAKEAEQERLPQRNLPAGYVEVLRRGRRHPSSFRGGRTEGGGWGRRERGEWGGSCRRSQRRAVVVDLRRALRSQDERDGILVRVPVAGPPSGTSGVLLREFTPFVVVVVVVVARR